jgi:hypothetical protein
VQPGSKQPGKPFSRPARWPLGQIQPKTGSIFFFSRFC